VPDLIEASELLNQDLDSDPEFRKEWFDSAKAREFGKWLRGYRMRRKMTVEALASKLTIGTYMVYEWESGTVEPSDNLLEALRKLK